MLRLFNSEGREKIHAKGEDQLFSYKSRLLLRYYSLTGAAGDRSLDSASPDAGELWVITKLHAYDLNAAPTRIDLNIRTGATNYTLQAEGTLAARIGLHHNGAIELVNPDFLRVTFIGCGLNDDLYLVANGYKMSIEA